MIFLNRNVINDKESSYTQKEAQENSDTFNRVCVAIPNI